MYTKIVLQQSAYTDLNRPIHTKFNSIAFSILVFLLPLHFPLPITISIFKVATIWITTTNQQSTSEHSTTQKEDGLTVVYFNVLSPQLVRTLFWGRLDLNADSDQWHTYIPTHIYIVDGLLLFYNRSMRRVLLLQRSVFPFQLCTSSSLLLITFSFLRFFPFSSC